MLRLTGIDIAVGLLGLAAFQNHWRARQLAVRAKQSELEALQARVRPHFLFNTLNSGIALVRQRPEQIGRASCRARVCQDVYISEVAEPLKKKDSIKSVTHHD